MTHIESLDSEDDLCVRSADVVANPALTGLSDDDERAEPALPVRDRLGRIHAGRRPSVSALDGRLQHPQPRISILYYDIAILVSDLRSSHLSL